MKVFMNWLPLALTITLVSGLIYATAQQVLRQGANDPQIQLAEDIAINKIAKNINPETTIVFPPTDTTDDIDVATSLSPFMVYYDETGKPLAGNGKLHGAIPTPPAGVFDFTKANGEDRVTWEPEPNVRIATVIKHVDGGLGGFVLAGRSLREVEKREIALHYQVLIGWLTTLVITLGATLWTGSRRA